MTTVKALLFSERKGSHCLVLNRGVISAVFFFFFFLSRTTPAAAGLRTDCREPRKEVEPNFDSRQLTGMCPSVDLARHLQVYYRRHLLFKTHTQWPVAAA